MTAPTDEAVAAPVATGHRRRLARSTAIFSLATGLSRVLGLVREIVAALLLRHRRRDQRVRGRVPDPEHGARARRRRRAVVRVRPRLQRAAREGRAQARLARRVEPVLARAARARRPDGAVHPHRAVVMRRVRLRRPRRRPLARALPDRRAARRSPGSSSGSSTATTTSPFRRSRRSFWNIAIIVGLVIGVPRASGIDAKLYVYAFSILIATLIQFLLPLPWLRGRDGRLQVVIDWRDPAVRQTLVLMVPITIGLGLINLNAVVDTFFAARLIDRFHAVSAINAAFRLYMLPQGMFSVAVATVLFPSLARLASLRRLRRLPADGRRPASGRSRSCSSRRASSAPCSRSRSSASSTSAATSRRAQTPGGRRLARGVLARPRLQRLHAHAEPRVLQPAVAVDPDVGRARQPRAERRARRGLLLVRDLGAAAVDRAREHRGRLRAVRPPATPARTTRPARDRLARVSAHRRRERGPRGRRCTASGGRCTTRSETPSSPRSSRCSRRSPRAAAAYVVSCRLLGFASSRRCYRCAEPRPARLIVVMDQKPHPQLLDHRAHRPRQVDARGSHPRADARRLEPRHARAAARLDGPRARARDHDQGAGRARLVEEAPAQPHRHARPRRLHLRGVALAAGVRGRAARRRRRAGDRGADARERVPRARERPRDHSRRRTRSTCRRRIPTARPRSSPSCSASTRSACCASPRRRATVSRTSSTRSSSTSRRPRAIPTRRLVR